MVMNVEWIHRLEASRDKLTKREQEILDYLEEHFEQLSRFSMQDVVDATNTSRPTVHRFCEKMGYRGFKAFKDAMSRFARTLESPTIAFNPNTLTSWKASEDAVSNANSAFELVQKSFQVDIHALQQTAATFTQEQIARIVTLLLHADTRYLVGYQSGIFPARFLAERLSRLGQKTQLATGEKRAIIDFLYPLSQDDVLVLFEYHKDFDFHTNIFEKAQQRGAQTILMTDYPTSPLVTRAAETLIVHRGLAGFKNSMAVPMTAVNALLLAVEYQIGDKESTRRLQEWEEMNP